MRDGDGAGSLRARTLLLIDDVRLRRECLFHLLSAALPDFDVLAFATTQPPETWAAASPDVVLACERSGDAEGELPIGEIVAAADGAPVLLLTETDSDDDAPAADEPGVAGRFPTTCGSDLLIAAIQLVLAGGRFQIPVRAAGKMAWRPHPGASG
jgi:DNA-binding NarL/FixJ family response regulator